MRSSGLIRYQPGLRISALVIFYLLYALPGYTQELTPRAYWPTPKGTRVITVGALHTSGDIVPDPSLPVTGFDSNINSLFLGYRHTLDLWGRTANLVLELPYSDGTTRAGLENAPSLDRAYQGIGDIAATLSVNVVGAPSLSREDFRDLILNPRPLLGVSLKLVTPTGRYDQDRLINVGANRWALKAEVGYIKSISRGWLFELDAGVWVFGDNDDFLGQTREQKPISSLQAHLIHEINADFWVALNMNAYSGGRSKVGDRRLDDLQRDSRIGFTMAFPLARGHIIRASYMHGSLNDSDESFDTYQFSYSRAF